MVRRAPSGTERKRRNGRGDDSLVHSRTPYSLVFVSVQLDSTFSLMMAAAIVAAALMRAIKMFFDISKSPYRRMGPGRVISMIFMTILIRIFSSMIISP